MSRNGYMKSLLVAGSRALLVGLIAAQGSSALAATLAYWRFEGNGVSIPVAGVTQVEDSNGRSTTSTGVGIRVTDVSGNGNDLWTWDHAWAGYTYQGSVAASTIPQTGEPNSFSVRNAGAYPAMFTWSKQSNPRLDLETVTPLTWTIEASINLTATGGNQTFVGRDGNGLSSDAARAPLYFQVVGGNLRILFTDAAGNAYTAQDTTGNLAAGTWYHVAAVSDGATLRLYRDSGSGYKLVGATALQASNPRLAQDAGGASTAGDTQWGWTLGRGRYSAANAQGDGHTDRFNGYIDEVRISDVALRPDQFLFARPVVEVLNTRPGAFNFAVLPDTQNASRYDPRIYYAQTQWVVDNASRLGIPFTMHLGDIVDQHGQTGQWQVADAAMARLESARLPYSILPGNHDVYSSGQWDNARTAWREGYLTWFGPNRALRNTHTFGGRDPLGYAEYHVVETQGQRFLVLALGWNSTLQTLDWAKNVMARIKLPTILTSHQIIDIKADEVSPLWTSYGEYLWSNLIRDNDQIFLTLNGHHHGAARDVRLNAAGKPVVVMVVDYQVDYQGGNGYTRLLQLDLPNSEIRVVDFSPWVLDKLARGETLTHLDEPLRGDDQADFVVSYDLAGRIEDITGKRPEFPSAQPHQIDAIDTLRAELMALPQAPKLVFSAAAGDADFVAVPETLAHWRFDGFSSGDPVPVGMPLSVDVSGNGNDLMRVDYGTPAENALVFSQDAHAGSASRGSVCFAGGGRNGAPGAYLTTFEGMPLGSENFADGYTIEAFFKLAGSFNADEHRWSGIISRVETGVEAGRGGGDAEESAAGLNISNIREVQWATFPHSRTDMQTAWSYAVPRERWHHVAAVNEGGKIKLYIDGISDFRNPTVTNAAGLAVSALGAGWMIGASHYNHQPYVFNGCIGEMRIVRRALAPAEFLYRRAP